MYSGLAKLPTSTPARVPTLHRQSTKTMEVYGSPQTSQPTYAFPWLSNDPLHMLFKAKQEPLQL